MSCHAIRSMRFLTLETCQRPSLRVMISRRFSWPAMDRRPAYWHVGADQADTAVAERQKEGALRDRPLVISALERQPTGRSIRVAAPGPTSSSASPMRLRFAGKEMRLRVVCSAAPPCPVRFRKTARTRRANWPERASPSPAKSLAHAGRGRASSASPRVATGVRWTALLVPPKPRMPAIAKNAPTRSTVSPLHRGAVAAPQANRDLNRGGGGALAQAGVPSAIAIHCDRVRRLTDVVRGRRCCGLGKARPPSNRRCACRQ